MAQTIALPSSALVTESDEEGAGHIKIYGLHHFYFLTRQKKSWVISGSGNLASE